MCIRDRGKLGEALAKLAEEDPTFRAHTDQETGQTIIAGMGELHLDIIVDRLLREFKVEANVGAPQLSLIHIWMHAKAGCDLSAYVIDGSLKIENITIAKSLRS